MAHGDSPAPSAPLRRSRVDEYAFTPEGAGYEHTDAERLA